MKNAQIGDGKLPNRYWVSISEDYYYFDEETGGWNWASDRDVSFNPKGATIKCFKTYKEAREQFDSISMEEVIAGVTVRSKFIEDRITGQLAEEVLYEHREIRLEAEFDEDIEFTRKKLEEKGYQFI